jgi:hypothetical protein
MEAFAKKPQVTRMSMLKEKWYLVSPIFAITFIATTNAIVSRAAPKKAVQFTIASIVLAAFGEASLCTYVMSGEGASKE